MGRWLVTLVALGCLSGCPGEPAAPDAPGPRTLCPLPAGPVVASGGVRDLAALPPAERARARREFVEELLWLVAGMQRGITCTRAERGYALAGATHELVDVGADWLPQALEQLRAVGYTLTVHRHGPPAPPAPHADEAPWTATAAPTPGAGDLPHYAVGTGVGDGSGGVYVSAQAFVCAPAAAACTWPADARPLR